MARERFHVLAGDACNNNCLFCMESEGEAPASRQVDLRGERVRAQLEEQERREEVMFTSGEPTLNPLLPDYVRWARELGYQRIGLTTNGRRLGYPDYARRLLELGLNHVVVSIHGPDARSHDALTRCPGSFAQTLKGLEALAQLKASHRFSVHTSTVVGRRNLDRLRELHGLLGSFGVDQFVLNLMQPLGRASSRVGALVARYDQVVKAVSRLSSLTRGCRPQIFLVDLPLCVAHGLQPQVRGWVELACFSELAPDGQPRERRTLLTKEQQFRLKRPECARCRHDASCLGVWANYVREFGWDEFAPVP